MKYEQIPVFLWAKIKKSCSLNPISKYDIPFVGLKEGEHHFHYTIDETFFELFENDNFKKANVEIDLQFEKGNFFQLTFHIGGTIHTDCDRCSEAFDLELNDIHFVIVQFNDGSLEQADDEADIIYIERNDTHLNLATLMYDFILLTIPMQKMHPDGEDGQPGCKIKYDAEADKKKGTDPRWDALKGLDLS